MTCCHFPHVYSPRQERFGVRTDFYGALTLACDDLSRPAVLFPGVLTQNTKGRFQLCVASVDKFPPSPPL